ATGSSARSRRVGRTPGPPSEEQEKLKERLRSLGYAGSDKDGLALASYSAPASPVPPPVPPPAPPPKPAETQASSGSASLGAAALRAGDVERSARKVVRNAQLLLVAKDTGAAVKHLTAMAPSLSGYVAGVSSARDGDLMSYTVTLKVPSGLFER